MTANRHAEERRRIAVAAARLIVEAGVADRAQARRKAARELGIADSRAWPAGDEIEAAVREHLRLFAPPERNLIERLRKAAMAAMDEFRIFQPRLFGAVLDGSIGADSAVCLHLHSDNPDQVALLLAERGIPAKQGSRRVHLDPEHEIRAPNYRFLAGEVPFDLTVLPERALRQAPLDDMDARPMNRLSRQGLERLLADDAAKRAR